MKISNCLGRLSSSTHGDVCAILSNRRGGFAVIPPVASSRYHGFFAMRRIGEVFRFVESIENDEPVLDVTNRLSSFERRRKSFTESFFMPSVFNQSLNLSNTPNTILYSASRQVDLRIVLDCKHAYDNREWGRNYSVDLLPQGALISFSKKDHQNDPPSSQDALGEYDLFAAVHSPDGIFCKDERWIERHYDKDASRNSPPAKRHVFSALAIKARSFTVGFGFSKAEAISSAIKVWNGRSDLIRIEESRALRWINHLPDAADKHNLAFACAANSLDSLIVNQSDLNRSNLYAGLPWFFQFWARDSAVSAKALTIIGRKEEAKVILIDQVSKIHDGINLPVFFGGALGKPALNRALDGIFWTFLRLEWLLESDPGLFSDEDRKLIARKLEETLSRLSTDMRDGLIFNGPKETWMDTEFDGDTRDGARIEMQCLALAAMRFAKKLRIRPDFPIDPLMSHLKKTAKAIFWNGNYLNDGRDDPTIRPNVFIAAYVYPELLTKKEWISCFDCVLPKLWLDWGGLATIARDHPLFTPDHTGEDVRSYHRGDSWFWINNMAALVMHRTDHSHFKKHIDKILDTSTKELLFMGAIGHHAELSSASGLKSKGCLAQAWSDAMYIELLDWVFKE